MATTTTTAAVDNGEPAVTLQEVLDGILEQYPSGAARIQRLLFLAEHAAASNNAADVGKKAYQAISDTCKREGNVVQYKQIFGKSTAVAAAEASSSPEQTSGEGGGGGGGDDAMMVSSPTGAGTSSEPTAESSSSSQPALTAGAFVEYDTAWVEEQEGVLRQSQQVLEHRLQVAQSQLHKESIRAAYLALAQAMMKGGDAVASFHALLRAKDYCTSKQQTTSACLLLVSTALALGNHSTAAEYLHKLEHTLQPPPSARGSSSASNNNNNPAASALGSTELDSILVQTALALERLACGDFPKALESLLRVMQHEEMETAFAAVTTLPNNATVANSGLPVLLLPYWVSPTHVSLYATLLCLRHGTAAQMHALSQAAALSECGAPWMRAALTAFGHAQYPESWRMVAVQQVARLTTDPYLAPHVPDWLLGLRRKALQQYWRAYTRVPLTTMQADLGPDLVPSLHALRNEWIELLLEQEQRLEKEAADDAACMAHTRLDMATDTLHRDQDEDEESDESKYSEIVVQPQLAQLTKQVLDDSYALMIRLACQEADLVVMAPDGKSALEGAWRPHRRGRGNRHAGSGGMMGGGDNNMVDEDDDEDNLMLLADPSGAAAGAGGGVDTSMVDAMNPEDLY